LGGAALLFYGFFYASFKSQAGGVLPYVFQPTRLAQYLVMFGPFIFILAFFLIQAARQNRPAFPLRRALAAWACIAGLAAVVYLLALLVGVVVLGSPGSPLGATLSSVFGDLSPGQGVAHILLTRLSNPWLALLLSGLMALAVTGLLRRPVAPSALAPAEPRHDAEAGQQVERFVLLLAFVGLGLTLLVEFFYLRDNFGVRMNSVFKFYYQAWILMACASAYAVWRLNQALHGLARGVFQAGTAVLVAAGLVYPLMGVLSRTDSFRFSPNLDAAATYAGLYPGSVASSWAAHPDDWAAIQWLRANGRLPDGSVPTILEASGGGYENAGRISAFTGYPTLLGWTNHEGQWRGTQEQINARAPVVQAIFTGYDARQALQMLIEWRVRYVIIGDTERDYITRLCLETAPPCSAPRALEKFSQVLTPVFSQGHTTIYQVPGADQP
jgi:uncharacterized membrane protein